VQTLNNEIVNFREGRDTCECSLRHRQRRSRREYNANELRVEQSHVADVRSGIDNAERSAAGLRDEVTVGKDALRLSEEDVLNRRAIAERAESDVKGASARINALRTLAESKVESVSAAVAHVDAMKNALDNEAATAAIQSAKAETSKVDSSCIRRASGRAEVLSKKKAEMLKSADELFVRSSSGSESGSRRSAAQSERIVISDNDTRNLTSFVETNRNVI